MTQKRKARELRGRESPACQSRIAGTLALQLGLALGLVACQSPQTSPVAMRRESVTPPSAPTIHIEPTASPAVQSAAAELAGWLEKSASGSCTITTNQYAGRGIYLGLATPDMKNGAPRSKHGRALPSKLATLGPEGIYFASDPQGVSLIGNSELALSEAVYLYLERLGFRWYFADPAWHIVPASPDLFPVVELLTAPSYRYRVIWSGYGTGSKLADQRWDDWQRYNRMGGWFTVRAGHAYPAIVKRNRAAFDAHPEYFATLTNGLRDVTRDFRARKFCVTNEGLIELCIADAIKQLDADPKSPMVSMDPSDGQGSCECDACRALGSISDRIFYLANRVALAIGEQRPGKWVGLYAYSSHQMPTKLKLAPNLYVMIATAYNSTPLTLDELMVEWGKRVTAFGIREYYGVFTWDWDMPGLPRLARIDYLRRTIPHFHQLGARGLSAETSVGWVNRGLGHYLAAKLLWDPQVDVATLEAEFFADCFGSARAPIQDLYARWRANVNALPTPHDMASWFRLVAEARSLTRDPVIVTRLDQINYYLRYVALFYDYRTAPTDEARLKAFESMLNWVWRVRDTAACPTHALTRKIANNAAPTPLHKFNHPQCIWKQNDAPVTAAELAAVVDADRARFKEIEGLQAVPMADSYVPLANSEIARLEAGSERSPRPLAPSARGDEVATGDVPLLTSGATFADNQFRGRHEFIIDLPAGETNALRVAMGFVKQQDYQLPVRLYRLDQETGDAEETPLFAREVPCDQTFHEIDLSDVPAGTYRLVIDDRRTGFRLQPSARMRLALLADSAHQVWTTQRSNFYLHVPAETRKFALVITGPITLQSPAGRELTLTAAQPMHAIEVGPGETGLWPVRQQTGRFYLLGIPAVVGLSPGSMLVARRQRGSDAELNRG